MDKKDRARLILDILEREFPDAAVALDFSSPLELLVATILSAQTTDKLVNRVTPDLFKRYRSASDYAGSGTAELERHIGSVNFFRNKAKNIKGACRIIDERHGGRVPSTLEELTELPGVGRKTANIILANAFGKEALAVDTHVKRVAKRLGLSTSDEPDRVEDDLCRLIPSKRWSRTSTLLILHGRKTCKARNPACKACPVARYCDYYREMFLP